MKFEDLLEKLIPKEVVENIKVETIKNYKIIDLDQKQLQYEELIVRALRDTCKHDLDSIILRTPVFKDNLLSFKMKLVYGDFNYAYLTWSEGGIQYDIDLA